jgi:hypothetical protein
MVNTQGARNETLHPRAVEDLPSIFSRHRERARARGHKNEESASRIICDVRGRHHKQDKFGRCLRSNVITSEERKELKPSSVDSMIIGFCMPV